MASQKTVSYIRDSLIQMNQNHGIEIVNYHKNELRIQNCSIEDNFCDGVHVSSEEVEENNKEDLL